MVALGQPALGVGVSAVLLGLAHPLHTYPSSVWGVFNFPYVAGRGICWFLGPVGPLSKVGGC